MAARTPTQWRLDNRRNMLRDMFYIARENDHVLSSRFGGATSPVRETRGTTPGSRTPEWIRTKSGTKQQSMTDSRARLFICCAVLGTPWNTSYAQTKTDAVAALTALSV